MSWKIVYTAQARQDLRSIYEYICHELRAPISAAKQSERIMQSIRELQNMPLRYRLFDNEPWRRMGLRFFPVDNYLIYYWPKEDSNVINIVRVIYGGRDVRKQLTETMEF